jgi:hypothetical protein
VATLAFTTTDRKVFTPISTALSNLRNATAGTIIVLVKQTTTGAQDFVGLTNSGATTYYHGLIQGFTASTLGDDDNTTISATATWPQNTTNWYLIAVDWSATNGTADRFHWRDQTAAGTWTHSAGGTNNATAASATTAGWLRIGYIGDFSTGAKNEALVAIWSGTRFADADYGSWSKTSDLYNHALGHPTFLSELNTSTPSDLIGGSTYSSANSTGTTLTGADPDNWTLDGVGGAAATVVRPKRRSFVPMIRAANF